MEQEDRIILYEDVYKRQFHIIVNVPVDIMLIVLNLPDSVQKRGIRRNHGSAGIAVDAAAPAGPALP